MTCTSLWAPAPLTSRIMSACCAAAVTTGPSPWKSLLTTRITLPTAAISCASYGTTLKSNSDHGQVPVRTRSTAYTRIADNWRPLFAIAYVAGADWPQLALEAYHHLTNRRAVAAPA